MGWPAAAAASPVVLLAARDLPTLDGTFVAGPGLYLLIVSNAAILATVAALIIVRTARQAYDGRAYAIGMGLLSHAAGILIHLGVALALPGASLQDISLSLPAASPAIGSIFFAWSVLDLTPDANERLLRHTRRLWALQGITLLTALAWELASSPLFAEGRLPGGFAAGAPVRLVALLIYAFATWRQYLLYRRSPGRAGIATTIGHALLGAALLAQLFAAGSNTVPFWIDHAFGFGGVALITVALLAGNEPLAGLTLRAARERLRPQIAATADALVMALMRGEPLAPGLRAALRDHAGLSDTQIDALEQASAAVAEERRQRKELERLDAIVRQTGRDSLFLAQMVIHDLKNPLTALIGFLDLLAMGELSDSQRLLLESAARSGRNLAGLVNDLLDLARYSEGRLTLNISSVPLQALCAECAAELAAWLAYESKVLVLDIPDELPEVRADARMLQRILLNLLSNALKHTPAGTTITLRCWREMGAEGGEETVIEVADNGPGIPPEQIERIFERFSTEGESRTARQTSTGLGLTFCRMAVAAHGGTIEVSSFPGDGASFRIRLPNR
ncbi:MAG: HAMP domain-containing histidine kinase [Chloroflexi bacterium]|nr:HAMP domain-containing histidine kinase [Chloroflexota bacterium]